MKICGRCGVCLDATEFNKNRRKADGLQRCCKPCQVALNRESSERHPETRRASILRDRAKHGDRPSKRSVEYKQRARRTVYKAILAGRLTRPDQCSSCGNREAQIHAHHGDYEKPLDITWLCPRCHGRLHASEDRRAVA